MFLLGGGYISKFVGREFLDIRDFLIEVTSRSNIPATLPHQSRIPFELLWCHCRITHVIHPHSPFSRALTQLEAVIEVNALDGILGDGLDALDAAEAVVGVDADAGEAAFDGGFKLGVEGVAGEEVAAECYGRDVFEGDADC
jgi:hypothetical protein